MTFPQNTGPREELQATTASGELTSRNTLPALQALLEVALEAARAAASVLRERSADIHRLTWHEKGTADFVSEVDLAAEARVREIVSQRIPDAIVAGEEGSPDEVGAAGLVFVVDPLDGTTNYLHGYPEYAVSIGVLDEGELVAGVVHNAANGEEFTALAGGGAWRDGERIAVSRISNPARALIGTGFPFRNLHRLGRYQRQFAEMVSSTSGLRRAGSAALDLCDVACGRLDAFWELGLAPWDIAAGMLIIREAGGIVTGTDGIDAEVAHGPIVASNTLLHEWMLDTLDVGDDPDGEGSRR